MGPLRSRIQKSVRFCWSVTSSLRKIKPRLVSIILFSRAATSAPMTGGGLNLLSAWASLRELPRWQKNKALLGRVLFKVQWESFRQRRSDFTCYCYRVWKIYAATATVASPFLPPDQNAWWRNGSNTGLADDAIRKWKLKASCPPAQVTLSL